MLAYYKNFLNKELETMALSDKDTLKHLENGNIIIEPFDRKNLNTSSYDVCLGPCHWREANPNGLKTIYSPYSAIDVYKIWGQTFNHPESAEESFKRHGRLEGIFPKDKIIWIDPGETILAHTLEFIGGLNCITSEMKSRSSLGRNFIAVCKCAGQGDVGYVNRWTMEITNFSRFYKIPLIVGRRVAQMVFDETGPIEDANTDYTNSGKYCSTTNIKELQRKWSPEMMLPKMFHDREVLEPQSR